MRIEGRNRASTSARRRFLAALPAAIGAVALTGRRAAAAPQADGPFVGEVRLLAGHFAPAGWFLCDGTLLPIQPYETLFYVIGTIYGGDGQSTFAVPDLRGRIPIHAGTGPGLSARVPGQAGGQEAVALTVSQLPAHSHAAACDAAAGTSPDPAGRQPARDAAGGLSWGHVSPGPMAAGHIGTAGSGAAHENRMPYLAMNYCIAWAGVYPPVS